MEKELNDELDLKTSLGPSSLDLFVLNGYLYPASFLFNQLAQSISKHWLTVSGEINDILSNPHVNIQIRQGIRVKDIPSIRTKTNAKKRWEMVKDKAETLIDIRINFGLGLLEAFNQLGKIDFNI